MNKLTEDVITYMNYAHIANNPDKCKILVSNRSGIIGVDFALPDADNVLQVISRVEIKKVFRYLGVPVGIMKITKIKFNNDGILKAHKNIERIAESGLVGGTVISVANP
jgi:hypothetical protein